MYLYFIQADPPRGPVKIGLADDPQARCDYLQVGNHEDIVLLAVRPGTHELERAMHAKFAGGHRRGEWFDADTPGLRAEIALAAQIEADIALGQRGMCAHCGLRPIAPPRTRVCSAECERERKRERSAAWRAARSSS